MSTQKMTPAAAARIESAAAKSKTASVAKGSFPARAKSAAAKNTKK